MIISGFIGVAIGIIFLYLMLSLMCTVLNEIVATLLTTRASFLAATIIKIIDDEDVRKAFYDNGLVYDSQLASGSTQAGAVQQGGAVAPKDAGHPSYLDSKNVAMAILSSLFAAKKRSQGSGDTAQTPPAASTPIRISGQSDLTMASIEKMVGDMNKSAIRDVLLASIATANGQIETLRDNLATWFDTAMDRLSGGYKRRSKTISIVIGFLLAVAVNADSYHVGVALWNDDALRNQIAAQAAEVVKNNPQDGCPVDPLNDRIACLARTFKSEQDALRPLPLGWTRNDLPNAEPIAIGLWIFAKGFAFLWTGLALSLGAPFWFDLLQKFVNIRGAGPKPAASTPTA